MLPPTEKPTAQSDEDSEASDDMNEGQIFHMPRRLLNSACTSTLLRNDSEAAEAQNATEPSSKKARKNNKKQKSAARTTWKKKQDISPKVTIRGNEFSIASTLKETFKKPLDVFNAVFRTN